ncbi:THAP domain-containing protein 4-like [Odontomachus brunneus]|uniref:THAP domain-containing protein 4-like n=1 Tax=Odontomachus brunneus TaxID=486640 RepID=UPI0013F18C26|nr:THAP domain-containing protein 4-like [Odontomachus brunneus]XP_032691368.1 THAP domain-containing protein 4-like [Odontomachus brunneus]XP_032691369.1 THAP domain-containing protein 4-like [Odontomachus brunneus]
MEHLPLHEALRPLAWLEGTWKIENYGSGKYPTIKDFNYCEEINFTSIGQPMFNYTAQSWHPESKRPMHRETGFLKMIPGTNKVSLVLAHNFGLATIEEGEVTEEAINLKSTETILRAEGTKSPAVTKLCREFKLVGDYLEQVLYMATSNTPELTEHLRAKYKKVCEMA